MRRATRRSGSRTEAAAPRRIVIFDAYPHTYGGAQRINHILARGLPARGWDVTVATPAEGTFTERLRREGISVAAVPVPTALGRYGRSTAGVRALLAMLRLPGYWLRLARALQPARPTIVHIADHRGILLAGAPALLGRAAIVWHVHAIDANRFVNRAGRMLAGAVVIPSRSLPWSSGTGSLRCSSCRSTPR